MSKLKGLVIPESVTESAPGAARQSNSKPARSKEKGGLRGGGGTEGGAGGELPSPPWKEKNSGTEELPRYSPAFKRKPFTVYNRAGDAQRVGRGGDQAPPHKPPAGQKRGSEELPQSPHSKTEDSDNDSAVSSGRSSLSGRSSSPPSSPRHAAETQNPRVLKKNSVEAINRQNVLNACKKAGGPEWSGEGGEGPLETSSPRGSGIRGSSSRPASRSSSFTPSERKKSWESGTRRGSSSSVQESSAGRGVGRAGRESGADTGLAGRRTSRETPEESGVGSRRSSRVTTPTGNNNYPDSILDIEEKVAFMNEVVDRASSATPTERRSVSRTPSLASERSSYSSRSSRNSSIVSEKAPFARNCSILSKDSAISEDITSEVTEVKASPIEVVEEKPRRKAKTTGSSKDTEKKWSELEKKYSKGLSSNSIGETISKLSKSSKDESKNERPKDLAISHKKLSNGMNSPSSKNFKELAEKWQTISVPADSTPSPSSATLPRKGSKEGLVGVACPVAVQPSTSSTLPRKTTREKSPASRGEEVNWAPPDTVKNSYYQVPSDRQKIISKQCL